MGRVVDVQESSDDYYPRPMMAKLAPAGDTAMEAQPSTTITPGENTITTTVDISYETF